MSVGWPRTRRVGQSAATRSGELASSSRRPRSRPLRRAACELGGVVLVVEQLVGDATLANLGAATGHKGLTVRQELRLSEDVVLEPRQLPEVEVGGVKLEEGPPREPRNGQQSA